jgi:hypothetical protein
VTLYLNWHTITYDSADFNNDGVIDPLAVPNGGFEVPLANDPTKPAQWDLTGAPLARLVASRTGMWGSSALRLDNVTAAQRLISAPIDLATDRRAAPAAVEAGAEVHFAD